MTVEGYINLREFLLNEKGINTDEMDELLELAWAIALRGR